MAVAFFFAARFCSLSRRPCTRFASCALSILTRFAWSSLAIFAAVAAPAPNMSAEFIIFFIAAMVGTLTVSLWSRFLVACSFTQQR